MTGETKTFLGFGLATLLIIALGVFFFSRPATEKVPNSVSSEILVRGDSVKDVSQNEKVTLVEFGDYQCPACAAYHNIVKEILLEDETITYVFRHFPLSQHKNARPASQAAEAAGRQGKYWEMHNKLYENQSDWENSSNPKEIFEKYATEFGLDLEKFKSDFGLKEIEEKVSRDYADGVTLGVNSTPSFYINNKKVSGIRNKEDFKRLISEYSSISE